MALTDENLRHLILKLLRTKKARDKQRMIGASGIGNPCAYCLAQALLATAQRASPYWLGAKIGDAIHNLLETEVTKHLVTPESHEFNVLKDARPEQSVFIGNIPGYGDIWSTPDLFIVSENHLVDYKTTKRVKLDAYRLGEPLPTTYIYQVQLYARALIMAGFKVDKISFVFINRDGVGDNDIQVISVPVDLALADQAWDRVVSAWEWLEDGNDVETLPSDPNCFVCNQLTHRMGP